MKYVWVILGLLVSGLILSGCEEDAKVSDAGNVTRVQIVITRNGTSTPLPGASILVDNNLSCTTSDPDGDCTFVLGYRDHVIQVSMHNYGTIVDTFHVSTTTTIKYFTLYQL